MGQRGKERILPSNLFYIIVAIVISTNCISNIVAVDDQRLQRENHAGGSEDNGIEMNEMRGERPIEQLEAVKFSMANAQEIVDRVNNDPERKWHAEILPRFNEMTPQEIQRLAGTLLEEHQRRNESSQRGAMPAMVDYDKLPTSFDAREKWPKCASLIGTIRDQSSCGSCWAVSVGSMVTDRLCIKRHELGNSSPHPDPTFMASEADVLACSNQGGCNGGWPSLAVEWLAANRIVSGGNYSSDSFCMPYPFPPHKCKGGFCKTPECTKNCTKIGYYRTYLEDKVILGGGDGLEAGHFTGPGNIQKIKAEIYARGPVVATMTVLGDFFHYKAGIYDPTTTQIVGYHAVRLIGWGEGPDASGVVRPYWLVANSWNIDFGEAGFFRIIMNKNAADFETSGFAYLVINNNDV